LALTAVTALAGWLGSDQVRARLQSLLDGQALQGSRLELWWRTRAFVTDFPVWGTGNGTFPYVEPLSRSAPAGRLVQDHAHNEYLEALVEGGGVRLALSVLTIGLVFRSGWAAVRRHDGQPTGGLASGALFGFTTVVIHSLGDFGLHIPAVAFLATVLCAPLCALGGAGRPPELFTAAPGVNRGGGRSRVRLGGVAAAAGTVTALTLGGVVLWEAWRAARVHQLWLA